MAFFDFLITLNFSESVFFCAFIYWRLLSFSLCVNVLLLFLIEFIHNKREQRTLIHKAHKFGEKKGERQETATMMKLIQCKHTLYYYGLFRTIFIQIANVYLGVFFSFYFVIWERERRLNKTNFQMYSFTSSEQAKKWVFIFSLISFHIPNSQLYFGSYCFVCFFFSLLCSASVKR